MSVVSPDFVSSLQVTNSLYSRFLVNEETVPLRGHVISFHESLDLTLHVSVSSNVLDFDFDRQSSRPDVG